MKLFAKMRQALQGKLVDFRANLQEYFIGENGCDYAISSNCSKHERPLISACVASCFQNN